MRRNVRRILCGILLSAFLLTAVPLPSSAAKAADCSAKAAVVLEPLTGTLLYAKDPDLPLPEASTTKIMTALLILETVPLTDTVTVSENAAAVEGSQLGLKAGDALSVRDLLYILMLKSGNDAAVALAEHAAGNTAAFAERMNGKAAQLGLNGTHFQNPHGLPDDSHYTTARDLATLTAYAMKNKTFRALVSTRKVKLDYHGLALVNSNRLLYTCDGACGVKTGFTKKAGRCLVSAAERNGITLICVTLNDPADWQDHAALFDTCFARVKRTETVPAGAYRVALPVAGGEKNAVLTNASPLYGIALDGVPVTAQVCEETPVCLFAPVFRYQNTGHLVLKTPEGREIDRVPLYATEGCGTKKEEPSFARRFSRKFRKLKQAFISGTAF